MTAVTLATCAELPDGDDDGPQLLAALHRHGVPARFAAWDDAAVDWRDTFVVLRSTWDYTRRLEDFRRWVEDVPRVANPAAIALWNTDKVYLRELAAAGVPTVSTSFAAPMQPIHPPSVGEFVVKPSVGAGSRGVGRFTADTVEGAAAARDHAAALHGAGRTVLVQPYVASVDTAGETALIYFDGSFSHAIRKGPMLAAGAVHPGLVHPGLVQPAAVQPIDGPGRYVEENISAREPSDEQLRVADQALAFVRRRFGSDLLYARVDLLEVAGGPAVVELELTEPSLFLDFADAAADTFAAAIGRRV